MTALLTAGLLSLSGPVVAQDSTDEPQQDEPQQDEPQQDEPQQGEAQQDEAQQASQEPHDSAEGTDAPAEKLPATDAWKETFPPENAASYLPAGDDVSVIVVAAGDHAEVDLAAGTLEQAFRDGGDFKLVMNDEVLAENAKVDDETIIEKAKHLPVGHVAIVRVFAGAGGKPPSGVVTLYDKDSGEALTAMAITRGTPLEANARPTTSAGAGVSKEAAEAVAATTEISKTNIKEAKQEYLERYVWFEDVAAVNGSGGVVATWSNVYRGKYKEPLDAEEFYEEVGRSDLAEEYRNSRSLMIGGAVVGSATFLGGILYPALSDPHAECDQYDIMSSAHSACEERASDTQSRQLTTGVAFMGLGAVITVVSLLKTLHPIEPSEARRLAEKHNKELRSKLGLSDSAIDEQASNLKWSVDVAAMKDGGGLRLRLEF